MSYSEGSAFELSDGSSDKSSCNESHISCLYDNESGYTEVEAKAINIGGSSESSDSDEVNSSCLENLHWCSCSKVLFGKIFL